MLAKLRDFATVAREAAERLGLDPGPIEFRVAPSDRIYELAAYGLPVRPSHWTHGRDYWQMREQYSKGQGRLYEIIFGDIDRHVAYLLEGNTLAAQKLVMAHCQGHADLDRRNIHLAGQAQRVERVRLATPRIEQVAQEEGETKVEWWLDRAFALYDQVADEGAHPATPEVHRSPYADLWDAPASAPRTPRQPWPTRDVLGFIAREARGLTDWQRDICLTARAEGLYFSAMRRVKLMHEAWAMWANQRILTDPTVGLTDGEQVATAALLAGVAAPSKTRLNPYSFGWQFLEWLLTEHGWETVAGIWATETDASLLRNYLAKEAMRHLKLYRYQWARDVVDTPSSHRVPVWAAVRQTTEWEALRDALANSYDANEPRVTVEKVAGGVLFLRHEPDGQTCDRRWAKGATQAAADLWGGPVQFEDGNEAIIEATPHPMPE